MAYDIRQRLVGACAVLGVLIPAARAEGDEAADAAAEAVDAAGSERAVEAKPAGGAVSDPAATPAQLFELLGQGVLALDSGERTPLPPQAVEQALQRLTRLPEEELARLIDALLSREPQLTGTEWDALLRLLARVPTPHAVEAIVRAAVMIDTQASARVTAELETTANAVSQPGSDATGAKESASKRRADPLLALQTERALAEVLRADPAHFDVLSRLARNVPPRVQCRLFAAAAAAPSTKSASFLVERLGWHEDSDRSALAALQRVVEALPTGCGTEIAEAVEPYAEHWDETLQLPAIEILGATGGADALESLVGLLESGGEQATDRTRVALASITGFPSASSVEDWRRRIERDRVWFESEYPRLAVQLEGRHRGKIASVLGEFMQHPTLRRDLGPVVARVLEKEDPTLHRLACSALEQMSARNAVPQLVASLRYQNAELVQASWSALRKITGLELPVEADAWRTAIGDPVPAASPDAIAENE